MRGRHPYGPEYVDKLQGSDDAKQRARVILETMAGQLSVQEACQRLGICEQRFDQLRQEMLQAAVTRLETQPAGRRPAPPEVPAVAALQEQVVALQGELQAAEVREEIALALPKVVHKPAEAKKKDRRRGGHGEGGRNHER